MDYGYSAPSAVHWAALDEIGRLFVYRELYETKLTYKALAKKIVEMTPEWERPLLEGNMVADPAIYQTKGESSEEKSGYEQMFEETQGWLNFKRGNNNRIVGWGIMRDYLKPFKYDDKITARLIYFTTCRKAIETIPAMVYDSVRIEDADTKGDDHCGDADRYGVVDVYELFSEKAPEPPQEVRTTDEIKKRDLKALKEEREAQDEGADIDWMTM